MFPCSVFEGLPIPYPKREFLTDDDNEDKPNTGASKVSCSVGGGGEWGILGYLSTYMLSCWGVHNSGTFLS